jgi:hypothetical protein
MDKHSVGQWVTVGAVGFALGVVVVVGRDFFVSFPHFCPYQLTLLPDGLFDFSGVALLFFCGKVHKLVPWRTEHNWASDGAEATNKRRETIEQMSGFILYHHILTS